MRLSKQASAFAYVQIPVYPRVIGYQLVPTYTASVGVNYRMWSTVTRRQTAG